VNQNFKTSIVIAAAAGLASASAPALGQPLELQVLGLNPLSSLREAQTHLNLQKMLSLHLSSEGREAQMRAMSESHGIQSRRYQIFQDGVEIIGGEVIAHEPVGHEPVQVSLANLNPPERITVTPAFPQLTLSVQPSLSPETAVRLALEHLTGSGERLLQAKPALKILPESNGSGGKLLYWLNIQPQLTGPQLDAGRDILIDAHSGQLIADLSHHIEISETINHTRRADSTCQTLNPDTGSPSGLNVAACPTAVRAGEIQEGASRSAFRAYLNANRVLGYFSKTHNRMSYDGKGSELVSVVHVGNKFANAFWSTDGGFMAYGDGDGAVMGDLTRSLDVAGHEMTHGVTSATSKLIYMDESGALNEAFSDFFGVVIAARALQRQPDWAIGKEIFNNERKLIGLRNLKDPASIKTRFLTKEGAFEARPYPSTVAEKFESFGPCTQRNDRCYVHVNSMIPGRAMVLISEAIGLDQAEKLMYLTLTQYLTASSGFAAFKEQTLAACKSTLSETECAAVTAAFNTVGF